MRDPHDIIIDTIVASIRGTVIFGLIGVAMLWLILVGTAGPA